jgi:hypothetical protein
MVVPSGLGGLDDCLRHLNGRANARASVWRPSNRRKQMKLIGLIAASFAMAATAAAQDAVPSLTGAWKGTGKILLYGTTEHLSGSTQNAVVRDLEVTHKVEGQAGRLIWGTTSSANNDSREPFAWALSSDNKTIVGADTDGYYRITIMSPDRIEKCYAQSAASPRRAIVATCFMMDRVRQ